MLIPFLQKETFQGGAKDTSEQQIIYPIGCVTFSYTSRYQGIFKSTISGVFEDLSLAETANSAESGQLQFWSEPSEILNLRSPNTQETVAFNIP